MQRGVPSNHACLRTSAEGWQLYQTRYEKYRQSRGGIPKGTAGNTRDQRQNEIFSRVDSLGGGKLIVTIGRIEREVDPISAWPSDPNDEISLRAVIANKKRTRECLLRHKSTRESIASLPLA